jgi:SAM-dependent methyltransferase
MAQLQLGKSVLDLGCAGGKIAALAKQAIGSRLVVGLDGVPGFLAVNATAYLASYSLTVAPAGDLAQRVYLIKGNITNSNISKHLALITSKPACYNVIFLIYVFKTIPPKQRCSLLKRLKGLLTLGSYIVISMSARFTNKPIASLEL